MALTYTMDDSDGFLLVRTSGHPDTAEEMLEYVQAIYDEVADRSLESFLVDETRLSVDFDMHIATTQASAKASLSKQQQEQRLRIRVAVVCASHSVKLYEHLENAARQNGTHNAKVFTELVAGKEWLKNG